MYSNITSRRSVSKFLFSASIVTHSSRLCANLGEPGPKFTATRPRSENCATGVQACFGSTSSPPSSIRRASSGCSSATVAAGAFETISSSPAPSTSSRSRSSAYVRVRPGA
jgi:hypothetical protein